MVAFNVPPGDHLNHLRSAKPFDLGSGTTARSSCPMKLYWKTKVFGHIPVCDLCPGSLRGWEPREEIGNSVKQTVREGAYGLENATSSATSPPPRGHRSATWWAEVPGWERRRGGDRRFREQLGEGDEVAQSRPGQNTRNLQRFVGLEKYGFLGSRKVFGFLVF